MEDLTNKKYNKLTVVGFSHRDSRYRSHWLCRCECGKNKIIEGYSLKSGGTKSCGCLWRERTVKHGESNTRFYRIWGKMKSRCLDKKNTAFKYYGGRGIKVCGKWINYLGFKEDMYDSYLEHIKKYGEKNTSIDRINNDGNYSKENCRWATRVEQANNTRRNHLISFKDEIKTIAEWEDEVGIKQNTIVYRLKRGWSLDKALSKR